MSKVLSRFCIFFLNTTVSVEDIAGITQSFFFKLNMIFLRS